MFFFPQLLCYTIKISISNDATRYQWMITYSMKLINCGWNMTWYRNVLTICYLVTERCDGVLLQADGERFLKMLCNQSITKNTVAFRFWKGKSEQTSRLSNLTSTGSLAQHKRSFFTKSSVSTLTSKPKSSRPLTMAGISACKPAAKAWTTQKKEQDFFA